MPIFVKENQHYCPSMNNSLSTRNEKDLLAPNPWKGFGEEDSHPTVKVLALSIWPCGSAKLDGFNHPVPRLGMGYALATPGTVIPTSMFRITMKLEEKNYAHFLLSNALPFELHRYPDLGRWWDSNPQHSDSL